LIGGPLVTVAEEGGLFQFGLLGIPQINSSGKVVFGAIMGRSAVFTWPFGELGPTTAYPESTEIIFDQFPSIGDDGTVAFAGMLRGGDRKIFTAADGVLEAVMDPSGPFRDFFDPSINGRGEVAFNAYLDTGEFGVFKLSAGSTVAISVGHFDIGHPSINNNGLVAFHADGVYVGDGGPLTKVVARGDQLFGATVRVAFTSREGINDAGQVAFLAYLDDGTGVIGRADPVRTVSVPGPPNLLAIGLAAALVAMRLSRPSIPLPSGGGLVPAEGGDVMS